MKGYLSIREAAENWGVSERRVNQYCAEGRIPGVSVSVPRGQFRILQTSRVIPERIKPMSHLKQWNYIRALCL